MYLNDSVIMKNISTYKNVLLILILFSTFSCNLFKGKEPEKPKEKDSYLVDFKKIDERQKSDIIISTTVINQLFKDVDISFIKDIANDVEVYTIRYNTVFKEEKIIASGLVVVPKSDKKFPVISLQNGTTVEHKKAPTVNYKNSMLQFLNIIASTGFIVAMPDYLGFGASEQITHPYLDKESTVQSIIDMLKAVKELTRGKIRAKSNKDLYIAGYSQGGWSTLCLQKALELQNPEMFNLVASSCGAGPYSLEIVTDFVLSQEIYEMPFFLAYVFNTMVQTGKIDQATIDKVVKEPYADKITTLFDGIRTGGEINGELSKKIKDFLTEDFIENYKTSPDFKVIRDELQRNSVAFWKTSIPTKLFHGTTDTYVPFATSQEAYDRMIELGTKKSTIELIPIPNQDHSEAVVETEIATTKWFLELKKSR